MSAAVQHDLETMNVCLENPALVDPIGRPNWSSRRGRGAGAAGDEQARPAGVKQVERSRGSMPEPAKVFEDRLYPGDWRVEWEDDDGGVEVTILGGPDAGRALQYADWRYCDFVEPGPRRG
jgi:hypothetical protein